MQLKKEYYKEYRDTTTPMYIQPMAFELYERMEGTEWVIVKDAMLM